MVIYVRDLQLASARRNECFYYVKDRRVIEIYSDNGEIGLGLGGFFLNLKYPAAVEFRHAETLRIVNFFQKDLCPAALFSIVVRGLFYI